jgi:hypothetical protein
MQCAPKATGDDVDDNYTCFTYDQLKNIAVKYNKRQDDKKTRIVVSKEKNKLWKNINRKMRRICDDDESCWINNDTELKERFRPKAPLEWKRNPRTWLSNFDIYKVLKQYEKKYPTFEHVGVFPRNYDDLLLGQCVSDELCNINMKELLGRRKYQLGIVFNLDPHDQPGSHWVAVYINISNSEKRFLLLRFQCGHAIFVREEAL